MTAVLQLGALSTLGYKVQSAGFGTPAAPAAAAGQWVRQLANDLHYDKGEHEIEVGGSSPDPTQFIQQGFSQSLGSVDHPLQGRDGINLLAFFLGAGSDTTSTTDSDGSTALFTGNYRHLLVPKLALRFLTLEDQFSSLPAIYAPDGTTPDGQSYRLDDCSLDTFDLSKDTGGWRVKYSVLGGLGATSIAPPTVPTFGAAADVIVLQWGHTSAITLPGAIPLKHLSDFKLQIRRNVQRFQGPAFHATDAYAGPFQVSGSYDVLFATAAAAAGYVTNYVGETEASIALTIGTGSVLTTAAKQIKAALSNKVHIMTATKRWQVGQATMMTFNYRVRDSFNSTIFEVFNQDSAAY